MKNILYKREFSHKISPITNHQSPITDLHRPQQYLILFQIFTSFGKENPMNPISNKKRKIALYFSLFTSTKLSTGIILFSLLLSCSPTESVFKDQKLTLQADAGVTEAWLTLSAEPLKANAVYTVKRDTSLIFKGKLNKNDTLLYDSGLKPNENYKYTAYAELNGERSPAVSAEIVTMDTTGHDFSWTTYEFGGQGGSSAFYDVAIIDENDIWAVGEIYTDSGKYNAAHWNGEKWKLNKLDWDGIVSRLTCVFAFSSEDVWFGVTNLIHWNGVTFEKNWNPVLDEFYDKTVNKMWGTSSEDLYIVGNSGLIAHYNGHSWTKIESGTDFPINDIYGLIDNPDYIFLTAGDTFKPEQGMLLKLNLNKVSILTWDNTKPTQSVYITNSYKYYVAGYYLYTNISNQWIKVENSIPSFCNLIRGDGLNNIFAACDNFKIAHYNGISWETINFNKIGILNSIKVKNNNIAACGYDSRKAYIILGKN